MEQIQENEQWKLNGNCEKCRRNNYCSKPCTRHNRRISLSVYWQICIKVFPTMLCVKR